MFDDCDPPPRYYTKASSHCWIPYVWCQNPHLWSAKKLSNYPTTTFCLLKHGKTLRFFPFLHVFFVRILRHPAWRKATRHTLNKAQLTANKGRARTLLQGTTITCVTCVMGELCGLKMSQVSSIFWRDFICIYAWLCANPLWPSALWIFRFIQQDHHPSSDGEKLKQQSMKPPISRGSNQCLPVFVGPQPPMF